MAVHMQMVNDSGQSWGNARQFLSIG